MDQKLIDNLHEAVNAIVADDDNWRKKKEQIEAHMKTESHWEEFISWFEPETGTAAE